MSYFLCFSVISTLIAILSSSPSSDAYRFLVGGKDGWVLNPSENYDHWAQRSRFSVNDTLYFKFTNSSDSVLIVSRDDYDECKTENPVSRMGGGDFEFKFDRSGPFYFITGIKQNCQQGQKLITVVLAVRNRPTVPSPPASSPTPSPQLADTPTPSPQLPDSPTPSSQLPDSPLPSSLTPPPPTGSTPTGGANSTAPAGSSATEFKAPSFMIISTLTLVSTLALYRT